MASSLASSSTSLLTRGRSRASWASGSPPHEGQDGAEQFHGGAYGRRVELGQYVGAARSGRFAQHFLPYVGAEQRLQLLRPLAGGGERGLLAAALAAVDARGAFATAGAVQLVEGVGVAAGARGEAVAFAAEQQPPAVGGGEPQAGGGGCARGVDRFDGFDRFGGRGGLRHRERRRVRGGQREFTQGGEPGSVGGGPEGEQRGRRVEREVDPVAQPLGHRVQQPVAGGGGKGVEAAAQGGQTIEEEAVGEVLDAVEERGEGGRGGLEQWSGGREESREAAGQGAAAVGGGGAVDPAGGPVAEPGGRIEVEEDPYGHGRALHQRGRGGGQGREGRVGAQPEVVRGGAVGEGHESGRVGGVVASREAGQGPDRRFEQVAAERGGGGTGLGAGAREMAAAEGLQEVEGLEEFGQGRGLRQDGGRLLEPYVDQLGQIAPRGGGQPGEDLRRGRPAVGGGAARRVTQGAAWPPGRR